MLTQRLIVALVATTAAFAQPNPYVTIADFFKLPDGRTMGSSSAVAIDSKGHIWIAERCGANSCADKTVDPILEFDQSGKLLRSFGGGMLIFPHGIAIDKQDNIWITDGQGREGIGHVAIKFSPEGKVLMTLGKPGVAGDTPDTFNQPNAVAIAPNGDIFVSDGHSEHTGNARVLKFDKDGKFIKWWGGHGSGPGQFEGPHALAFDSKGRLFVADRGNSRIQIFDQDGKYISEMKQFSRPSGIFIDKRDNMYVADSESQNVPPDPNAPAGKGRGNARPDYQLNPGWKRGIRIGNLKDGKVVAFIPDPETENNDGRRPVTTAAEGVAADAQGNVYGAEVGPKGVKKYVKK
jgi:streptogramin lyase